jgi:CRISPR/Cas system CSM-associated protein Csm3 (group 7 of RAMP superfamily)
MNTLRFTIEFAGPFRVSTGHARPGVDAAIDLADALPASSLKGLMRATTKRLLGTNHPHVERVFGSAKRPTSWEWDDAVPDAGGWAPPMRASRVRIGPDHIAEDDMLGIAEQTQSDTATFTVTQRFRLDAEELALHRIVLAVAARATRSLGANRRRGLGWVHISCADVAIDTAAATKFLTGRRA